MKLARLMFLILSFTSLGTQFVHAQTTSGSILGDVTDATGARLPGVTVKLLNQSTGAARETLTSEVGSYRFDALPPVDYTLTVELTGFSTVTRQNIKVPVATAIKIDFSLQVASTAETITVTEEVPLVETTENAVKTLIDNAKIEALPLKTRDFMNLALLAPGVVSDQSSDATGGETDSVSFGGMSERFKSMWLEGVDFNDEVTGGGSSLSSATRTQLAEEAIQEFQVMANSYSAEFGRTATGVINIVTKSGTNEFHGGGFIFRRDDRFAKPNYFARDKDVPPFNAEQYGATLGGPIVLNRTHFFGSYERRTSDRTSSIVIPATILNFVQGLGYDTRTEVSVPSKFNNYFGKLTHTFNPKHSLSFTALFDNRNVQNTQAGGTLSADSGYGDVRHSYFMTANLTSLLGSRFVNEFRFNDSYQQLFRTGTKTRPTLNFPSITFGRDQTQGRSQGNWIVSNTMSYNTAKHSIRFGFEGNVVNGHSVLNQNYQGTFDFLADQPVDPTNPATLPYRFTQGVELRKLHEWTISGYSGTGMTRNVTMYAAFVNDSFRVLRNLTLTLGLRYDLRLFKGDIGNGLPFPTDMTEQQFWVQLIEGNLRGTNYRPVPNDKKQWSPRIGLSWDPRNDGKTVIRAGAGLFHDKLVTETLRTIVGGYPGFIATNVANDSRVTNRPNTFFPNYPADRSILSEQGGSSFRIPSRTAETPYMEQYSAGVSHQLAKGLAISADYIYMYGLHFQITSHNMNARLPNGTYPLSSSQAQYLLLDTSNISKVKSLQFRVDKRFSDRFSFSSGYTYGHINEIAGGAFGGSQLSNAYDLKADFGPSGNDIRHRLTANSQYELPYGIKFGAVWQYSTGAPYNVITGNDDNRDLAITDRPAGVGYNSARGDTNTQLDLRTSKKFRIHEKAQVEVLWEMYNVFNTVNFLQYTGNMRSSLFGKPSAARDPFQGQIGAKFSF